MCYLNRVNVMGNYCWCNTIDIRRLMQMENPWLSSDAKVVNNNDDDDNTATVSLLSVHNKYLK